MAIYKPSNCSPYFGVIDAEGKEDIYFQCEVNCSNLQEGLKVNGYSITVYNENNNEIFSSENIVVLEHAVVNGDILRFKIPENLKSSLRNGNTYKWVITLYQGIDENGNLPPVSDIYAYDMIVTSGQLLGSYNERIQSKISDQIYADYYIQPIYIPLLNDEINVAPTNDDGYIDTENIKEYDGFNEENGWIFVGPRVLIQSYDYSFGHIYPTIGSNGIKSNVISDGSGFWRYDPLKGKPANGFCIYKYNNDFDIAKSSRKVRFVATNFNENSSVEFDTTEGSAVGGRWTQILTSQEKLSSYPAFSSVSNVSKNDRVIINRDSDKQYNGIFVLSEANEKEIKEGDVVSYEYTLVWTRASDANTWGSLISTIQLVQEGEFAGQNVQVEGYQNDGSVIGNLINGKLNTTEIKFIFEQPIEIYPEANGSDLNVYDSTIDKLNKNKQRYFAPIYYNTEKELYIRPFSGLKNNSVIYIEDQNELKQIESVDKGSYKITLKNEITNKITKLGENYSIKTCSISSDENIFYCYKTPILSWDLNNIVDQRYKTINVIYDQDQKISWKYYSFYLYDENNNLIQSKTDIYNGAITFDVYGLINGKAYSVKLVIEDQLGRVVTEEKQFVASFEEKELDPSIVSCEFKQNCETASNVIEIKSIIYTLPGELKDSYINSDGDIVGSGNYENVEYNNAMLLNNDYDNNGVVYRNYYPLYNVHLDESSIQDITIPGYTNKNQEDSKRYIQLQSEHILTGGYTGEIIGIEIENDGSEENFSVIIPEMYDDKKIEIGHSYKTNMVTIDEENYPACNTILLKNNETYKSVTINGTFRAIDANYTGDIYNCYVINNYADDINDWAPVDNVWINQDGVANIDKDFCSISGYWNTSEKDIQFPIRKPTDKFKSIINLVSSTDGNLLTKNGKENAVLYDNDTIIWTDVIAVKRNDIYEAKGQIITKNVLYNKPYRLTYFDNDKIKNDGNGKIILSGELKYWKDESRYIFDNDNETIDPETGIITHNKIIGIKNSFIREQIKKNDRCSVDKSLILNKKMDINIVVDKQDIVRQISKKNSFAEINITED